MKYIFLLYVYITKTVIYAFFHLKFHLNHHLIKDFAFIALKKIFLLQYYINDLKIY